MIARKLFLYCCQARGTRFAAYTWTGVTKGTLACARLFAVLGAGLFEAFHHQRMTARKSFDYFYKARPTFFVALVLATVTPFT